MPKMVRSHFMSTDFGTVVFAAQEGAIGDWAAYVAGIAGTYEEEIMIKMALDYGAKLPHAWAAAIFPDMERRFTWRE